MKILASNTEEIRSLLNAPYVQNENLHDFPKILELENFNVYYNDNDNGGGIVLKDNFIQLLDELYTKNYFKTCLEWCSGPGFIGFNLLDKKYISSLDLMDCSINAINSCQKTINNMNIPNNVNTFCDITIKNINKKYDLIVGNPPWYPRLLLKDNGLNRIYCDLNFQIHQDFFSHANNLLNTNGRIILVEGLYASHPSDFDLSSCNLELEKVIKFDNGDFWHDCYMMIIKRKLSK